MDHFYSTALASSETAVMQQQSSFIPSYVHIFINVMEVRLIGSQTLSCLSFPWYWADVRQVKLQSKRCRMYCIQLIASSEPPSSCGGFAQEYLTKCLQHLYCLSKNQLPTSKIKAPLGIPEQGNSRAGNGTVVWQCSFAGEPEITTNPRSKMLIWSLPCSAHCGSTQLRNLISVQRSLKYQNITGKGRNYELGVKKSYENTAWWWGPCNWFLYTLKMVSTSTLQLVGGMNMVICYLVPHLESHW